MRAWVAPNGTILCTDPQFASLTGVLSDQMVGGCADGGTTGGKLGVAVCCIGELRKIRELGLESVAIGLLALG